MKRMVAVNTQTVLELEGTELREVLHGPSQSGYLWKTDVSQLVDGRPVSLWRVDQAFDERPRGDGDPADFGERRIGCCQFSEADWALITEARERPKMNKADAARLLSEARGKLIAVLTCVPPGSDFHGMVVEAYDDADDAWEALAHGNVDEWGGMS